VNGACIAEDHDICWPLLLHVLLHFCGLLLLPDEMMVVPSFSAAQYLSKAQEVFAIATHVPTPQT
jgi:hypothetical protein